MTRSKIPYSDDQLMLGLEEMAEIPPEVEETIIEPESPQEPQQIVQPPEHVVEIPSVQIGTPSQLKYLFLVRHGSYKDSGAQAWHLTQNGLKDIIDLGNVVNCMLNGIVPKIWSSNAIRALESSQGLARILGISEEIDGTNYLWSSGQDTYGVEGTFDKDCEKLTRMIEEKSDTPALLVVSHIPLIRRLSSYFIKNRIGNEKLAKKVSDDVHNMYAGNAIVFDIQEGSYTIIPTKEDYQRMYDVVIERIRESGALGAELNKLPEGIDISTRPSIGPIIQINGPEQTRSQGYDLRLYSDSHWSGSFRDKEFEIIATMDCSEYFVCFEEEGLKVSKRKLGFNSVLSRGTIYQATPEFVKQVEECEKV